MVNYHFVCALSQLFVFRQRYIFFYWIHIGMSLGANQQTPSCQATRQSGGFGLEVVM